MRTQFSIGFPYVADRFGGSTASSLALAQALKEAGHRVHILTHGSGGRVTEEAMARGLPVTPLPALSSVPGYARPDRFRLEQVLAFRAARAAIGRLGLDIVHVNDITMLRSWAMPSLHSAALVVHWRSNYRDSWSVKMALKVAAGVIAVSQYSFAALPAWVRRKGVVEYNPFDLSISDDEKRKARAEIRQRFGMPADAVLLGVFGNHVARKRTHVLADVLKAVPRAADGRPVYGLACGGRVEPYDHELDRKIAAYDLERRLARPGFVRPMENWMAACDLVLAPAVNEPFGRTAIEALALGVPVVASTDAGLKELIRDGENGLLCDPYDLDGWIASTRRVLDNPALASRLASAGRSVVDDLTPGKHAVRVACLYRGIMCGERQAA